jgi:hypothetical protein
LSATYGGAVISQAAPTVKNVRALVFLSAYALDEGESFGNVMEPFPPSMPRPRMWPARTTRPEP